MIIGSITGLFAIAFVAISWGFWVGMGDLESVREWLARERLPEEHVTQLKLRQFLAYSSHFPDRNRYPSSELSDSIDRYLLLFILMKCLTTVLFPSFWPEQWQRLVQKVNRKIYGCFHD